MRESGPDRRKYPRGADVFTRIEDVTYQVLRRLEADSEPPSVGEGGTPSYPANLSK